MKIKINMTKQLPTKPGTYAIGFQDDEQLDRPMTVIDSPDGLMAWDQLLTEIKFNKETYFSEEPIEYSFSYNT